MSIVLEDGENVFFPQPWVPGEAFETMVTSKRLVRLTDAGMWETPVGKVDYVGRTTKRPFVPAGAITLVVGLTLVVLGVGSGVVPIVAQHWPAKGLPGAGGDLPPCLPGMAAVPGVCKAAGGAGGGAPAAGGAPGGAAAPGASAAPADPNAAPADDDDVCTADDDSGCPSFPDNWGWGGVGMLAGGLVAGLVGFVLLRKQKFVINAKVDNRMIDIDVKDKNEQTSLLSSLTSASNSARQQEKMAAKQQAAMEQAKANAAAASAAVFAKAGIKAPGAAGAAAAPAAGAAAANPYAAWGAAAPAAGAAAAGAGVEDGGDPVKALQVLKWQKDMGYVDQATFDAKRAALLEKLAKK